MIAKREKTEVTEANDPWSTLSPGNIDARRVLPDGNHDFFWVVSGKGEPGLLLRIRAELETVPKLPRMRSLDLQLGQIGGSQAFMILLKDPEQKELFTSLCRDVVRAGEVAQDNADALQRSIRRTMRWHHLLRGGLNDLLSLEEQRGLVGELNFLARLADLVGAYPAIEAWKGPVGASKDFELDGCLVEVKARRGAAKPFVQISSEDQLSDVDGCRIFLAVTAVDAAIKPSGSTLTDHVLVLEKLFQDCGPEAYGLWEAALADTGFDFEHDYSDRRWIIGKTQEFEVADAFPRIASPLVPGVSGVRYSIAIDACMPFSVEPGTLNDIICERVGQWTN